MKNNREIRVKCAGGGIRRFRLAMGCLWVWAGCAVRVLGGIVTPLFVGNVEPVCNEYGMPMPGSRTGEEIVSLVEVREACNGLALPPSTNGAAHVNNPLLGPEGVGGMGENVMSPDLGLFCLLFRNPPADGTRVFVRVYNASTPEEASFYADSSVVEVDAGAGTLVVEFGKLLPMDSGDDDGDGLINAWEKSMGTFDRPAFDYDGDGMTDLAEMRAGTVATNASSLLTFSRIESVPEADGEKAVPAGALWQKPVRVSWQSVPGRTYQLEYAPIPATTGEAVRAFAAVGDPVIAGDEEYEISILVDVEEDVSRGMFRVRLITED